MRREPVSSAAGVSNKRRNIDDVVDAEEPREVERDQHGRRAFALGDQIADRRLGIDVLLDLGGQRELADGGRRLEIERFEVDVSGFTVRIISTMRASA